MPARKHLFETLAKTLSAKTRAERTPLPEYKADDLVAQRRIEGADLVEPFVRNLKALNGRVFDNAGELAVWLHEKGWTKGYCDPDLFAEYGSEMAMCGLEIATEYKREALDEIQFSLSRAHAGIAESGTVVIREADTPNRLAALAPWVHITLLPRTALRRSLGDALADLGTDAYTVWATGPSKTADVEGILIEGVHGPGRQVALLLG